MIAYESSSSPPCHRVRCLRMTVGDGKSRFTRACRKQREQRTLGRPGLERLTPPAGLGSLARGRTVGPRQHGAPRTRPVPARCLAPHPLHAEGPRCQAVPTPPSAALATPSAWRGVKRAHRCAWRSRAATPTRGPDHPPASAAQPPAPHRCMRCAQPPPSSRHPGAPSPGGARLGTWAQPRPPLSLHRLPTPLPRRRAVPRPPPLPHLPLRPPQAQRSMAPRPPTLAASWAGDVGQTCRAEAAAHGGRSGGQPPICAYLSILTRVPRISTVCLC